MGRDEDIDRKEKETWNRKKAANLIWNDRAHEKIWVVKKRDVERTEETIINEQEENDVIEKIAKARIYEGKPSEKLRHEAAEI